MVHRFWIVIQCQCFDENRIEDIDSRLDDLDINFEDGWIDVDESITYIVEGLDRDKVEQIINEIKSRITEYEIKVVEDIERDPS